MTKPVALADETYRRLRSHKRPGESFSNAIDRLIRNQKKDPLQFVEAVPRSKIPAKRRLREVEKEREASWEDA